jgi:signal transduction histidine kinase
MPATRRTRYLLLGTFGAIAAMLLCTQLVGYMQAKSVDESVDVITKNALTSIELIGRMAVDLQREHILIDRHIFEKDPAQMALIEEQIGEVRDDFARATHQYEGLAMWMGEPGLWHQLRSDADAAERQETIALDYSRKNQDAPATSALVAGEPVFEAVTRDLTKLTDVNREAAVQAQDKVSRLQRGVALIRLLLAVAIIALTAFLGMVVTQAISRTERGLRRQAQMLEARNRELDAFAGRVSHDLRGPLNTIKLASSMIGEELPAEKPTVEIMDRAVTQMTDLVNDLLQLSRAGAPPTGAVAQIAPIATSLETDLSQLVEREGGELHVDLEPAVVTCSQGLLREVLWNLGENAVKYHRHDVPPAVELVGRAHAGRYSLRVIDNGRGMTLEEADHVFEPFFRGNRVRDVPGTGLGLAIVRRVVEASGGSVAVESQPDHGTTFTVELPLAA